MRFSGIVLAALVTLAVAGTVAVADGSVVVAVGDTGATVGVSIG